MAVGDMTYKFTDNDGVAQEVVISAEVLRKGKRRGLTNRQTIMEYAFNEGFAVDQPELTPKETKKTARKRQPNDQKRELINALAAGMSEFGRVDILNPERVVQIVIEDKTFEFTLVQKRKKS